MDIFRQMNYKRLLVIVLVTIAGVVLAGCTGLFPQFTYQGVLTDASGNPLNGSVSITYRIFNVETGGTAIYTENETVNVTEGRFDSVVGPNAALGSLTPEDLAQALWIEIQIDNGTYNETLEPRQRLYGAPYAFTLMPGTVISSTMNEELFGANGINAIASINNMQVTDGSFTAIPALRVVGEQGIELVGVSNSRGSIYSDLDNTSSDLFLRSNDNFNIYLDNDNNETGTFWVMGSPTTNNCYIQHGNLACTGTITAGSLVNGETRSLYAVQSPEVRIEDFGSAQLSKGTATVQIDSLFAQTVNLDVDYHVFLTPLGDCNGLYVINKTATGFEVRELGGGTSDVSFDYRIIAKRTGYEKTHMEVVPMNAEGEGH